MSLFATVKKKEAEPKEKLCGKIENVKVLGLGCATCHKQLENAQKAVKISVLTLRWSTSPTLKR